MTKFKLATLKEQFILKLMMNQNKLTIKDEDTDCHISEFNDDIASPSLSPSSADSNILIENRKDSDEKWYKNKFSVYRKALNEACNENQRLRSYIKYLELEIWDLRQLNTDKDNAIIELSKSMGMWDQISTESDNDQYCPQPFR